MKSKCASKSTVKDVPPPPSFSILRDRSSLGEQAFIVKNARRAGGRSGYPKAIMRSWTVRTSSAVREAFPPKVSKISYYPE